MDKKAEIGLPIEIGKRREMSSVHKIVKIIKNIYPKDLRFIRETENNGREDTNLKWDIVFGLKDKEYPEAIGIQSKSNQLSLEKFVKSYCFQKQIDKTDFLKSIAKDRLIILNGQSELTNIVSDFNDQLGNIYTYYHPEEEQEFYIPPSFKNIL
jgi:hypothetical protein